jgi:hypothetical protein
MAVKRSLKRIVFRGGAWDGRTTKIDAGGSGRAERWAKEEGETHVYAATEETAAVEVEHDTKSGKRYSEETAQVYELVERKPDLASAKPPA